MATRRFRSFFDRAVTIDAPLAKLPLFVRAGAIVPLRDFASSVEAGSNAHLTLELYPGGDSEFALREDDGTSNDYLTGGFATTKLRFSGRAAVPQLHQAAIEGQFTGRLASRRWTVRLHGQGVARQAQLNGSPIASEFDEGNKVLTCTFDAPTTAPFTLEWK